MSDKKQETKQPTKSESAKPYPLRSIDYTENPKDIITIEQPIEDDK